MSPPDHYELSMRCRHKAEEEFAQGDLLTAAEMMWGAVVHAIKYIAPRYTSARLNSHFEIKRAVPLIDAQISDVNLRRLFGEGEVLHRYFYRLHLADHQAKGQVSVNGWCAALRRRRLRKA